QEQQLGLERIGVLELVDEDALESRLEAAPHVGVAANEVARAHEQVEEVERAFALLQRLVPIDARQQLGVEQRGEVRIRAPLKIGERSRQRVARGEQLCARDAFA